MAVEDAVVDGRDARLSLVAGRMRGGGATTGCGRGAGCDVEVGIRGMGGVTVVVSMSQRQSGIDVHQFGGGGARGRQSGRIT